MKLLSLILRIVEQLAMLWLRLLIATCQLAARALIDLWRHWRERSANPAPPSSRVIPVSPSRPVDQKRVRKRRRM